jgi:hypothetical protein
MLCWPGIGSYGLVDVFAGVMVLSEVAQRLMMMSGSDASTSAAEYSQAATSRMNEVATTPSQRDIASPADRTRNFKKSDQASFAWPHSNDVPSTQMQWRITAILRAMATFAFLMPIPLASFIPQALREDHFFVR